MSECPEQDNFNDLQRLANLHAQLPQDLTRARKMAWNLWLFVQSPRPMQEAPDAPAPVLKVVGG